MKAMCRKSAVLAMVILSCGAATVANATTITPIDVSGFTKDVIVEVGGTSQSAGAAMADWHYDFFEKGRFTGDHSGYGVTCGSSVVSNCDADATYKLASATSNNALALSKESSIGSSTGTLLLTKNGKFDAISIFATTSSFSANINYAVNYTDATSTTGTVEVHDWYYGNNVAVCARGRALWNSSNSSWELNDAGTNYGANLYQIALNVDKSKVVSGISFTQTNNGTDGGTFIMAVSGSAVPEPGTLALVFTGVAGLLAYAWKKRK